MEIQIKQIYFYYIYFCIKEFKELFRIYIYYNNGYFINNSESYMFSSSLLEKRENNNFTMHNSRI